MTSLFLSILSVVAINTADIPADACAIHNAAGTSCAAVTFEPMLIGAASDELTVIEITEPLVIEVDLDEV